MSTYNIYLALLAQLDKLARHNRQGSFQTKRRYYEAMQRFCRYLAENHIVMKKPNTVAGIVAIVLAALLGVGWALYTGAVWSVQLVLLLVALAFLSWLCAMLGYDKVMQTLAQIKR